MSNTLEIHPRLCPDFITKQPNIGPAVQLRQKFQFLLSLGVFGVGADLRIVCRRMYQTSTFIEPASKTDQRLVEKINDVSAYGRLDNLCRRGSTAKSMIQAELDFLRSGFVQVFGRSALTEVSDEQLRTGTMSQILGLITQSEIELDLTDIDPILVLDALANSDESDWIIEIIPAKSQRWTQQEEGETPILPDEQCDLFPTNMDYRIYLDASIAKEKPFCLEFIESGEGKTKDGRPVRAQILPLPIHSEAGDGPWRISHKYNKPLTMGGTPNRFGFCALSGLGLSFDTLFPKGYNAKCLSDHDLRYFVTQILAQMKTSSTPIIALYRFRLIKPGEL